MKVWSPSFWNRLVSSIANASSCFTPLHSEALACRDCIFFSLPLFHCGDLIRRLTWNSEHTESGLFIYELVGSCGLHGVVIYRESKLKSFDEWDWKGGWKFGKLKKIKTVGYLGCFLSFMLRPSYSGKKWKKIDMYERVHVWGYNVVVSQKKKKRKKSLQCRYTRDIPPLEELIGLCAVWILFIWSNSNKHAWGLG